MKVLRVVDAEAVARRGADRLGKLLQAGLRDQAAVLALPTGRTAVPFYAELRKRHERGDLDLARARAFNLDELLLPTEHPASFHTFMRTHAWERIGLDRERCDIPRWTRDPKAECARYDRAIEAAEGLDIAILGVGEDGHVAYNLPGPPISATHIVRVPDEVADRLGLPGHERPLRAMTVGMETLRSARHILLMATGSSKAQAIRALTKGPEDPRWPCSLLRSHPRLDVIVDPEAADLLPSLAEDHRPD